VAGLQVDAEKGKYVSSHQNTERNHNIKIAKKSLAGSCEQGNHSLGSIQDEEFLG
jgi:hypothetical protein